MPNRIIKESIITSETLAELTGDEERLFWRLVVLADDFGRFHGDPALLRPLAFPRLIDRISQKQFDGWLRRLADVGLIRFYEVDGKRYMEIPTWSNHQQQRASSSKFPSPPPVDSARNQLQSDASRRQQMSPYSYSNSESDSISREPDEPEAADAAQAPNGADPVVEFHAYYCEVWRDVFHRGPQLTEGRRKKIKQRLKRFTLEQLKQACDNLHASPWHRGENPHRKPYGDIDFLIRSDEMVDKWLTVGGVQVRASPPAVSTLDPKRRREFEELLAEEAYATEGDSIA